MNWTGGIILTLSAYLFGVMLSKREGEKLKCIEALILLFEYMERQIIYLQIPLYSLLSDFKNPYLQEKGFLPLLCQSPNRINASWEEAIKLLPIEQDIKQELSLFGKSLGNLPLEQQEKNIKSCLSALYKSKERIKTALPAKQKSIRTVSLLLGLCGAIVLL